MRDTHFLVKWGHCEEDWIVERMTGVQDVLKNGVPEEMKDFYFFLSTRSTFSQVGHFAFFFWSK